MLRYRKCIGQSTAIFLSTAVFMLAGGRLADIFGQRRIFSFGVFLFGFASLLCGMSMNATWLIICRLIQGIAGALLLPPTIPLLLAAFPEHKKGWAVGLQTASSSLFMIMGPFVGGLLAETWSWRSIFWINVPLSLIGLWLIFRYIPSSTATKKDFDFLGFSAYSMGILCLTVAIIQAQIWGWFSLATIALILLGIGFLFFLYLMDRRSQEPFIHFSLFRHSTFKEAALSIFTAGFQVTITIFLPIYLQKALVFSAIEAGFWMTMTSLPVALGSPIAGKLLDRYGLRFPLILGQCLTIFSFVWIIVALPFHHFGSLAPALLILSFGLTSILTPSFTAGIGCIEPEHRGIASGLLGTIRALGGNFGVAATGSVIANTQLSEMLRSISSNEETATLSIPFIDGLVHALQPAMDALQHYPESMQQILIGMLDASYQHAFGVANLLDALLGVIGLLGVLTWMRKKNI